MNEKIGYKDIFRQREYMKMIIAALINRFGDSIDAIATTWLVYEITNDAAWSAIIYAINRVPTVVITPFAGAWVEGRNKKRIMIITDIIRAICVAVVATGYLFNFLQAWILVLTTLIISTVEAFRGPANSALTPQILEKQFYEYGMSLMSTLSTVVELIGTALAAGIIALIGTAGAIYVDMSTFLLSAMIIMLVNVKETNQIRQKFNVNEYKENLLSGFKYVKSEKKILFFCGIAIFLNAVLVPFNSLQAPLTNEILHGGAEVLSVLGIALTGGMIIGSVSYPIFRKVMSARKIVLFAGLGIGCYYIGLIGFEPLYQSKAFMYFYVAFSSAVFGMLATFFNSFGNVELMKIIDEKYIARTIAVTTALCSAAMPFISMLISSIVALVDTKWIFLIAGVADIIYILCIIQNKALDSQDEILEKGFSVPQSE